MCVNMLAYIVCLTNRVYILLIISNQSYIEENNTLIKVKQIMCFAHVNTNAGTKGLQDLHMLIKQVYLYCLVIFNLYIKLSYTSLINIVSNHSFVSYLDYMSQ